MNNSDGSRTSNSIRNTFYGIVHTVVETLLPFVLRTVILNVFNEQYLGLNNLFHSILSILSLAQVGFGTAISYTLYSPLAEKNDDKVCSLLNIYRKIYTITGCIVLICGLLLIPFLQYLIHGSYPSDINITIVYLLYLLETVSNFILFSEKSALLGVAQRSDIRHRIFTIVEIISYILRFISIVYLKNYYLYLLLIPLTTITIRIVMCVVTNKLYPNYICKGEICESDKKQIYKLTKYIAFQQFGTIITSSLGSIVVSAVFGLTSTAIYGNYSYIASALLSFSYVFINSTTASVGNSIASKNIDDNYETFNKISLINYWLLTVLTTCMFCLYQDFMILWVGEKLIGNFILAVSFTMYFYLYELRKPLLSYKEACGIWKYDRFKPIISGVANCLLTLIFTKYYGMLGPILSIITCAVLIELPWEISAIFREYFKKSSKLFIFSIIKNFVVTSFCAIVCKIVFSKIMVINYFTFVIKGILIFLISNIFFIIFYRKDSLLKSTIKQIFVNLKI